MRSDTFRLNEDLDEPKSDKIVKRPPGDVLIILVVGYSFPMHPLNFTFSVFVDSVVFFPSTETSSH